MTQDSNFSTTIRNNSAAKKSSGLLNRRQQHSAYLQNLELPSLPPLSQLLPVDKQQQLQTKGRSTTRSSCKLPQHPEIATAVQAPLVQSQQQQLQHPIPFSDATVAAAAAMAAGIIPTYPHSQLQAHQPPVTTATSATTAEIAQLIAPTAVVFPPTTNNDTTRANAATTNAMNPLTAMTIIPTIGTAAPCNNSTLTTTALAPDTKINRNPLGKFTHNNDIAINNHRTADPFVSDYAQQQFSVLPTTAATTNPVSMASESATSTGVQRSRKNSAGGKAYSFVSIPGTNQKKRPRRRYDEIERLYHCNYQNCTKSYGTLNHLNAHITMQKHGPKRSPDEFKEMRRKWREQKKEREGKTPKNKKKTFKQQQERQHFEKQSPASITATNQVQHPSVLMRHTPPSVALERLSLGVGYPSFIPSNTTTTTTNTISPSDPTTQANAFMGTPVTSIIPTMQPTHHQSLHKSTMALNAFY